MKSGGRSTHLILILILTVNVLLTVQGIRWGLPDRWNVDQRVTESLKMLADRTLVSPDFYHPPLYSYLLMLALAPYLVFLKCTNYPLDKVGALAADSWIKAANAFPDFASTLFIVARLFSCFLGVLTVVLVYRTARRMYSSNIALLAAGILAVTMGFVGANHLEISTSLINMLGMVVFYFCVKAIDKGSVFDTYVASFFAGLAIAAKLNGVFLIPLPFIAYLLLRRERALAYLDMGKIAACCGLGFLLGWPTYLSSLSSVMVGYECYSKFLFSMPSNVPIAVNFINYIVQLIVIFGVPLSIFVAAGALLAVSGSFKRGAANNSLVVLAFLVLSYIVMNGISVHHQHPYTKYIIFIVPQLAILGGLGAYEILKRVSVPIRAVIAVIFFGYSIAYTISGNAQFVSRDIRYQSTSWISANIPQGSTIEHVDQPDWLFSSKIISNYRIIYLGRDSRAYASKGFYKLNKTGNLKDVASIIEDYCKKLNAEMPSSEYFVIFLPEISDLYRSDGPVLEYDKLIRNFTSGHFPYELIATFKATNWRDISPAIKGLSYPHNMLWDPIPDNAYMPSVIMVYKRKPAI
jgi:4-amino-4-deoxy-L-arabinose transferase-like glycosyltransferase